MKEGTPLTPQEVADILRIKKNTVYELIKRGELKAYKVGKKIRIEPQDVEAYKNQTQISRKEPQPMPVSSPAPLPPVQEYGPQERGESPLVICGQDILLDILAGHLETQLPGLRVLRAYIGSYHGLQELYMEKVQVTASHLWDGDSGQYNLPYVRRLLPGIPAVVLRLCSRWQGFYVLKGNPKGIQGWEDLGRRDLTFINREKGSGTRVLLDEQLRLRNLSAQGIRGYQQEYTSHLAVATGVAQGEGDFGLGNEKTSLQVQGIDFIPLQLEHYDLVMRQEIMAQPVGRKILEIITSRSFQEAVQAIGGYELKETGKIITKI